jgi:hypothetical protein
MRWVKISAGMVFGGIAMLFFTGMLGMLVPDRFLVSLIVALGVGVIAYLYTPKSLAS